MFKRLIANLAAKSFGAATPNEYLKHNLSLFLDRNGIRNPDLVEYRVDRSEYQPHFFKVAMVGKAHKGQKLIGLLVYYDESIGTIYGHVVQPEATIRHGIIAKSYKAGQYHYRTLYNAFLFEMDGYDTSSMQAKQELS
jgi:hypothetical protein